MRATAVVVGIPIAAGLVVLGSIFDLNGQQWNWWSGAARAGAGFVVVAAVFWSRLTRLTQRAGGGRSVALAGGVSGAALVVLSAVVMARGYSDPYGGALFWPHALAVAAFIGLAIVVVSAAATTGGPCATERRSPGPS
jgi:hypothetical protein